MNLAQGKRPRLEPSKRFAMHALLAIAFGLILGASAPPSGSALPVCFLALGLALLVSEMRPARASMIGLVFGLGFGLVTMRWGAIAAIRFGDVGALVAFGAQLGLALFAALPTMLACALYAAIGRRSGLVLAACIALAFTLVPQIAPWRPIALGVPLRSFAQMVGLFGPTLADFLLLAPLGALLREGPTRKRDLAIGASMAIAVFTLGELRSKSLESAEQGLETARIVAIRPDVSIAEGTNPDARRARLESLRAMTRRAAAFEPQFIAWPESAHPYVLQRDIERDLPSPSDTGIEASGATLLFGALTQSDACHRYNGALAFDSSGALAGISDKARRMPFGDFIPVIGDECRDLRPAEREELLGGEVGALVCYDEVKPGPARARALQHAKLLVSFTNDAWFEGTAQPALHGRVARLAALETGLDLVRVVNVGETEHIGADGSLRARLPSGGAGRLVVDVPLRTELAPAMKLAPFIDIFFALALATLFNRRHLRCKSSGTGGR